MQTISLNAMANVVKGGAAQGAASDGAATAAAGGAVAGGDAQSPFGAMLAQQVSQGALLGGKQLSLALNLLQSDAKQGADQKDLTLDVQPEQGQLAVDPAALASLVAQALAGIQAKTPAASAVPLEGGEKASATLKGIEAKTPDGGKLPLEVADKATTLPQSAAKAGVEAAAIADSGKMLPLEVAKKATNVDVAPQDQFSDKLASAQQAMAQPSSSGQSAPVDSGTARIQQPVGAPGWGGELSQKVVWMVGQQKQSAELQLNPPNLGPLEVRISLNQDQMSATFVSHHAAVREAIEAALPRLREMLADNGIALGNVSVGAESFAQQQQQQQQAAFQGNGNGGVNGQVPEFSLGGIEGEQAGQAMVTRIQGNGLVNTFV